MDLDMATAGEYLPPYQGWISSVGSTRFENMLYETLADMITPYFWIDEHSRMVD